MPRKSREKSISGVYHVVNRGIGGQRIFMDADDFEYFLKKVKEYQAEEEFELWAYCLMDNHFHLLIHADHNLSIIMKRICTSYALYYNQKNDRNGHVFQNRFHSEPVDTESYLLTVVRYIHNNPEKAGIAARSDYPWSSWKEYLGLEKWVNTSKILKICGGKDTFYRFSLQDEEQECLDTPGRKRVSDAEAAKIIEEELKKNSLTSLQKLTAEQLDYIIRILKKRKCSGRQIARLTGIPRKVADRA